MRRRLPFVKMHGAGNDFVMVDGRDLPAPPSQTAIAALCHRRTGIGADGLILVLPSSAADVRMRMFNPDGSEAEMCGNGLRCVVKYAVEEGLAWPREGRMSVETGVGVLSAQVFGEKGAVERVRVSMGVPRFAPQDIPVLAEAEPPLKDLPLDIEGQRLVVTCVSMGNPHAVTFDDVGDARFELGPAIQGDPHFPEGVNVGFVTALEGSTLRLVHGPWLSHPRLARELDRLLVLTSPEAVQLRRIRGRDGRLEGLGPLERARASLLPFQAAFDRVLPPETVADLVLDNANPLGSTEPGPGGPC